MPILVEIPHRVKIIKKIFNLSLNGMGQISIARTLNTNKHNYWGDESKIFHKSYVAKILKNRGVLGEFEPHYKIKGKRIPSGNIIKNYYPRIIEENLFYTVQSEIRNRHHGYAGNKGKANSNLFSGLVKCAVCGSTMTMINKGKNIKYLLCQNLNLDSSNCSIGFRSYVNYKFFETNFFNLLNEIDFNEFEDESNFNDLDLEISKYDEKIKAKDDILEAYDRAIRNNAPPNKIIDSMNKCESEKKHYIAKREELKIKKADKKNVQNLTLDNMDYTRVESIENRFKITQVLKKYISLISLCANSEKYENYPLFYVIHFKNGITKIVHPDPNNPKKFYIVNKNDGTFKYAYKGLVYNNRFVEDN